MTIDRIQAWLNTAEAKAAGAWGGPWEWELDGADRVTLRTDGQVPFDLIRDDEFRGSTEDIDFIAYSRTAFPQAVAALQAVLDVHQKTDHQRWVGFPRADRQEHYCWADQQSWPYPTVQAITEKLGES